MKTAHIHVFQNQRSNNYVHFITMQTQTIQCYELVYVHLITTQLHEQHPEFTQRKQDVLAILLMRKV
jgi:hypothetical protein